jgi:hypothetical protein
MQDPFAVFERRDAKREELLEAAERLGPVDEPSWFWSHIANDQSMPAELRALALIELVRRHVVPGQTTVSTFAQMLDGAPWLGEDDLVVATEITGKVPVQWSQDDTVAVISLPGHRDTIYLVISGSHSAAEIEAFMRGKSCEPRLSSALIQQIAFSVGD